MPCFVRRIVMYLHYKKSLADESARADEMQDRYVDLLRRAQEQGVDIGYEISSDI